MGVRYFQTAMVGFVLYLALLGEGGNPLGSIPCWSLHCYLCLEKGQFFVKKGRFTVKRAFAGKNSAFLCRIFFTEEQVEGLGRPLCL